MKRQIVGEQSVLNLVSGAEQGLMLEAFFHGTTNPIVYLADDFQIKLVNQAFLRYTGFSFQKLAGNSLQTVLPVLQKQLEILFQKSRLTGESVLDEKYLLLPEASGETYEHWLAEVIPIYSASQFDGWVVIFHKRYCSNIDPVKEAGDNEEKQEISTEGSAKKARKRLHTDGNEEEPDAGMEFFQKLAEQIPLGLAIFSGKERKMQWSNTYFQKLSEQSLKPGESVAEEAMNYCVGEVENMPVLAPGTSDRDWTIGKLHCRGTVIPLRTGQEESEVVLAVVERADNPKSSESFVTRLEAERDHLEMVLDKLSEGLMIVDKEGRLFRANQNALNMLGLMSHVVIEDRPNVTSALAMVQFYTPEGSMLPVEQWPHARVLRGESLDKVDLEVRRLDGGKTRFLSFNGKLIDDPQEKRRIALLTFRDVTDRKGISLKKERTFIDNQRQREFLERLLETFSFGIAVIRGPEYRMEMVNRYAQTVWALPENWLGERIVDVLSDDEADKVVKALVEVYHTGRTVKATREVLQAHKEKKEYWEMEYVPLRNNSGQVDGVLIILTDITKQLVAKRRAEILATLMMELNMATNMQDILRVALRSSAIALNANDGAIILLKGLDGVNGECVELWMDETTSPKSQFLQMAHVRMAFETGKPVYFTRTRATDEEITWLCRSGMEGILAVPFVVKDVPSGLLILEYYWKDYVLSPEDLEFAASFGRECALGIERSQVQIERSRLLISERRARAQAERQTAEISALLQSLKEGVLVIDASGRIILRNQMERILTLVPDDAAVSVMNYGDFHLLWPDGTMVPPNLLPGNRLLRGEAFNDTEFVIERSDGSKLQIISNGGVVRCEDGKVNLAIITSRDVTQMRLLEEVREDFIRAVSHDLRNPLTVVSARSQLLQRRLMKQGLTAEAGETGIIYTSARRMNQMIQEMFDSYRLESSNFKLNKSVIDLAEMVQDLATRIGTAEDVKRLRLQIEKGNFLLCADQERLERAMVNLITNALKYSSPDKPVDLSVFKIGEEYGFAVTDYGMGIAPQDIPKVFQRYYRAKTAQESMGLGLGLHIVRLVVEAHGGRVDVKSELNQGSTFTIILPAGYENGTSEVKS